MTTSGGARPSSSPASQRRRRRIIDATFELLREHDAAKLSVADIAKVAGVSVASVYNLVGTRERVLAAVIDRYVERLAAALGEQLPEVDPVDAVVQIIRVAVAESLADPAPMKAVLRELGLIQFAENRRLGMDVLLRPRLEQIHGLDDSVETVARHIVYGFRGALMSWAHLLIDDDEFATDAELITRRLLRCSAQE